ncbi:hypothetical protein D9757_009278 [Collybiopsis confluens]|uniref:Alpha/beta hydrolase fold-3 domain-containing protein n=1 Tax=Collybiopsis confluens TaxID=2823264 RepID=A0A8H5M3K1_9AGAR|nr:hypothetical protein D9757_009278 [Collybiopsis confluens]
MDSSEHEHPKQPIHPSVISRLDPAYVSFHEKYLQHIPPMKTIPWNPALMRSLPPFSGIREPLKVGEIKEFSLKHGQKMRAYIPPGGPPKNGWPALIYFHGGGWILGGDQLEMSIITNLCVGARCIVLSIDYRLAPEHRFPAAVEDSVEALQWVLTDGEIHLGIDLSNMAVGGTSAGGNLAAVLALKSVEDSFTPPLPIPLKLQLLLAPSVDQTATDAEGGFWEPNKHAPYLSPAVINWLKDMYFQSEEDWSKWEASPLLAPEELIKKAPSAWVAAADVDVLRDEAEAYAKRLNESGVPAKFVVYKGAAHLTFVLDGGFFL